MTSAQSNFLFNVMEERGNEREEKVLPGGSGILYCGDALTVLKDLPGESAQAAITSPPYWGLRDYGIPGQIGAEDTVYEYIDALVAVFRELRRVLSDDGVFWLNVGDSYTSGGRKWRQADKKLSARGMSYRPDTPEGMKPKDLIGVPWMLAFALREDGWYLRTDIVWNKPNGLPESVRDRPTRSHEFIFMMTKSEKYYYDVNSTMEPAGRAGKKRRKRSVWNINTESFSDAHFATFPTKLVEPCLLASTQRGQNVIDPFFGSGTVGQVALNHGRNFTGIEMNRDYVEISKRRLAQYSRYQLPVVIP